MKEKGKVKKYKEKHKTDEPGVGEIALNYKRQAPVIKDKDIEEARKKHFKKFNENQKNKKKVAEEKEQKAKEVILKSRGNSKVRPSNSPDANALQSNPESNNIVFNLPLDKVAPNFAEVKNKKKDKKEEKSKKRENGWVGIGFGTGTYGEERVKNDLKDKKQSKSIFNVPKE